jgi:hypothetical protein
VFELGFDEAGDSTVVLHQQYPGAWSHLLLFGLWTDIVLPVVPTLLGYEEQQDSSSARKAAGLRTSRHVAPPLICPGWSAGC